MIANIGSINSMWPRSRNAFVFRQCPYWSRLAAGATGSWVDLGQFFAHISFVVNHDYHAFNVTPRKKWQQNHSLQNFCTNWIFAREGSTEADVLSHLQQLFTLHSIGNDYSTYQRPAWMSDEFFHGVAEKNVTEGQHGWILISLTQN